jgi:tetratricopeptide (TPR) repeat protein
MWHTGRKTAKEPRVALFGKKKTEEEVPSGIADGGWRAQPEKAAKFFEHARTVAQTGNYSYAIDMYARGLRFEPGNMASHLALYETAIRYLNSSGKPASGKEIRALDGPNPADKMAVAEFAWAKDINNLPLAMKLMQAIGKAGEKEFGQWLAPRMFAMMLKAKKQTKQLYTQGKDLFGEVDAWKEAFAAAERAIQIDPSDSTLISELNQLSAQRTISEGGFNQAQPEEGGDFRRHIKDADKQSALQDEESLSGGAGSERAIDRARIEAEENPDNPDAINKYAQLLRRLDTPKDDETATAVYLKGFESTKQYRFKMAAGDVKMNRLKKRIRKLDEAGEGGEEAATLQAELLKLRSVEFNERVAKYPTDRGIKFELGAIEYDRGNFEDAMAMFQQCKDESKYRTRATHMLGKCFAHENWHQEAVGEFREAIEKLDGTEKDRELMIRYDLMLSLIDLARHEKSAEEAREAAEICSAIVRKDISYRDIRQKRKEVDTLIKELEG